MSNLLWYSSSLWTNISSDVLCVDGHVVPTLPVLDFTCLFSASLTAWLTWFRIFLQHSPALFTFSFSSPSAAGKWTKMTNSCFMYELGQIHTCAGDTCVLGDVVQQQRVLSESLHLNRNDVFELQPATPAVTLSLLEREGEVSRRNVRTIWTIWTRWFMTETDVTCDCCRFHLSFVLPAVETEDRINSEPLEHKHKKHKIWAEASSLLVRVWFWFWPELTNRTASPVLVLTCINKQNFWSFFFRLLMSSSADGWLLQNVPTARFIFSSSSPLNWNTHTHAHAHAHTHTHTHTFPFTELKFSPLAI